MSLLFVVEEVFDVKERGVLVSGDLRVGSPGFRIGDKVQVRRRDVTVVSTEISGFPMGMVQPGRMEVLLHGISKFEVLPADEVWLEVPGTSMMHGSN